MSESTSSAPGADPVETVRAFLAALERLDVDAALEYAAPTMHYQNVPLPTARGRKAVAKQLRFLATYGTGFGVTMHNIAANGPVVLTERTDVLEAGPWRAAFWVCGTFEVHDGRITLWRDYFDWSTLVAASARGALRAAGSGMSRLLAGVR